MFPKVIDLIYIDQWYRIATVIVYLVQSLDPNGKYRCQTPPLIVRGQLQQSWTATTDLLLQDNYRDRTGKAW
jgi:hypothetical protein